MFVELITLGIAAWLLWWLCQRDERQSGKRQEAIEARFRLETDAVESERSAASPDDASRLPNDSVSTVRLSADFLL